MNALLLNRDGFQMPADGWYQVAPLGEFAHAQAGLTQVVDSESCQAMANRFAEEAKAPNFAGLLVDFDHFSLDGEKRSEAAGWITALENRDGGLFAKIRWSDVGESAVKGGRYRFLSPVWNRADCVDLGGGRVRPVRLLNAAVTNDPNLKGMVPLSNRGQSSEVNGQGETTSTAKGATNAKGNLANAGGAEPRFKWVLGDTPEGRHCPSCTAVAGQVHTMAEWDAAKVKPGADGLFCQGNCQCQLVPTDEPSGGAVVAGPVRDLENRGTVEQSDGGTGGVSTAKGATVREGKMLANIGWTDEARAASLAVRQAKAGAHGERNTRLQERQRESMDKAGRDYAAIYEDKGLKGMTAEEVAYLTARINVKVRNGTALTGPEERFVKERKGLPVNNEQSVDGSQGKSAVNSGVAQNRGETAAGDAVREDVRAARKARLANAGRPDEARAAVRFALLTRRSSAGEGKGRSTR
jgi:hypothetical protein